MTKTSAETVIGSEVKVSKLDNGVVKVSCSTFDGKELCEVHTNLSSAFFMLVNANYDWVRRHVLKRDKYRCWNCFRFGAMQVDHKDPRSKGRVDLPDNLVSLCHACHQVRHKKPRDFHQTQEMENGEGVPVSDLWADEE